MSMTLFGETQLPTTTARMDDKHIAEQFALFWKDYPKRVGGNPKKSAERSFLKAVKNGVKCETIIAGARRFAAECKSNGTEPRYIPMAVTWLNQERWGDDPDAGLGVAPDGPKSFLDMARELRERAATSEGEPGGDG